MKDGINVMFDFLVCSFLYVCTLSSSSSWFQRSRPLTNESGVVTYHIDSTGQRYCRTWLSILAFAGRTGYVFMHTCTVSLIYRVEGGESDLWSKNRLRVLDRLSTIRRSDTLTGFVPYLCEDFLDL